MTVVGIPVAAATPDAALWRYVRCLERAGGRAHVIRAQQGLATDAVLEAIDGLYLVGGTDARRATNGEPALVVDHGRHRLEMALTRAALQRDMPVFGICRGMQVLNRALGGSLVRYIPYHRDVGGVSASHRIALAAATRLSSIVGPMRDAMVNSRHRHAVAPATVAAALTVAAQCPDDGVIEAVESAAHRFAIGVQFHPDRSDEVDGRFQRLFDAFVAAC